MSVTFSPSVIFTEYQYKNLAYDVLKIHVEREGVDFLQCYSHERYFYYYLKSHVKILL